MEEQFPNITPTTPGGESQFRPAVILPDGSRAVDLGSGTITGLIGSGGMANIYKIWNKELEVSRAVKLMHPNLSDDSRKHFQTEMKIMAGLSHPNIVEIHSVGMWNGLPYIEMEHIDGATLDTIIKDRGALPLPVCTAIAVFIARALTYAHDREYSIYGKTYRGIIHRDLKPSNIMVSREGRVKLMDFGIARPIEASLLTTDGALMGTMQYMAPEQLDGKSADVTTDLYSLGAVVYEMITGVKAFPQVNITKLMACKVRNDYRPLDKYDIRIPRQLRRAVHRCMMQEKRRRMQGAPALLAAMEHLHRSLTPDTPEVVMRNFAALTEGDRTVLRVRRRIGMLPIALAAVVAMAVAGAATFTHLRGLRPKPVEVPPAPVATPAPPAPQPAASVAKPNPPREAKQRPARTRAERSERPAPAATPEPRLPLLERLKTKYGIADAAEIFVREVEAGNYADATELYAQLPADQSAQPRVRLYFARMLMAQSAFEGVRRALAGVALDDGEAYLYQGILAYREGRPSQALSLLEKSNATPCRYLKAQDVRREYLYFRAKCLSKLFDAAPSRATYQSALDAWYEVKSNLRERSEHLYFKAAVIEMNRLSEARPQ